MGAEPVSTFEQKRGLANLLAILTYIEKHGVPQESAQAVLDAVYEGGGE